MVKMKTAIYSTSKHNSNVIKESVFLFCILWRCKPATNLTRAAWAQPEAAPRGDWGGTIPSTPLKDYFRKSSKTDEKILGVWGGWRHQPY